MVMFETEEKPLDSPRPSDKFSDDSMEGTDRNTTAAVISDSSAAEALSENDSGVELTNENSPLTPAQPPSPLCPKLSGGARSPQDVNSSGRKKPRKRSLEEQSEDCQKSPESRLSLRQTPRPRTIFQAGQTPGKTRRRGKHDSSVALSEARGPAAVSGPVPQVPESPSLDLMEQDSKDSAQSSSSSSSEPRLEYNDNKGFGIGELVWGKIKGFSWWPGIVVTWRITGKRHASHGMRWLQWFGDGKFSEVSADKLDSITAFPRFFSQASYTKLASYRRAVFQVLEMASVRAEQTFPPCDSDPEEQIKALLDWANGGFLPKGAAGLKPPHDAELKALYHHVQDVPLPEYLPSTKRPKLGSCKSKAPEETYSREQMVNEVVKNKRSIEGRTRSRAEADAKSLVCL
ncbi:unnamed protein product [Knipowitschia caucasica]